MKKWLVLLLAAKLPSILKTLTQSRKQATGSVSSLGGAARDRVEEFHARDRLESLGESALETWESLWENSREGAGATASAARDRAASFAGSARDSLGSVGGVARDRAGSAAGAAGGLAGLAGTILGRAPRVVSRFRGDDDDRSYGGREDWRSYGNVFK